MNPLAVRSELVDALQLDLIGPTETLGDKNEVLPQLPSRWYLTGFLVPTDAREEHRTDPTCDDDIDQGAEPAGIDDDHEPDKSAARKSFLPSSMGASVLVSPDVGRLEVRLSYGTYEPCLLYTSPSPRD